MSERARESRGGGLRARRAAPAGAAPFISVIVPVRNEEAFIGDTLEQMLNQHYDPERFEVLVADGGSTDDTRAVVAAMQREYPNLRLLANPGRWSSAGRNVAIRAARGEVVLLIDGHCEVDSPHYLADLADAFERSGADCVGRPQPLDVSGATRLQRAVALARSSRLGHHPASHIWSEREGFVPPESVAVAYRRSVFERVGLFDEAFDACEDVELNHRVARSGMRCFFTPHVRVRYHPRQSLAGLFRQMVRYGRGRMRLLRKHPDSFSLPGFVPAAFLAGVVCGPLFALWSAWLGLLYAGVLGAYALAVLTDSAVLAVRARELALLPLLPPVFLAVHFGAGAGLWWEALRGSTRPARAEGPALLPGTDPAAKTPRKAA